MEQRQLGQTGVSVSALGFGCGDVGGLMSRGDAADQVRVIARALEAGITFFDTADSYGKGASEEALGRALRELGADPFVATKVTRPDAELIDGVTIRQSLEESLRRLGRDRVDLFLLHGRVGSDEGAVPVEHVLGPIAEAMVAAREAGLTRFIGFNGLGATADLHRLAQLGVWDAAHCYINALNPSGGWRVQEIDQQDFAGLIPECARNGVAPIAIRVLAAGALASGERHPLAGGRGGRAMVTGGEWERDAERATRLATLVADSGLESAAELSVRFVLSHPDLATLLLGYSSMEHLEDALRWVNRGPLSPSLVEQVLATISAN